jgi:hypothetical protein
VSREIRPEWGAVYEGGTLSLSLTPLSEPMSAERARFGRTLVDIRVRTRPDRIVVQLAVRFGPPLPVRLEIADGKPWLVLVDENPVEGRSAAFVASHEHEVQFLAACS